MAHFVKAINAMVASCVELAGDFEMDTVEVNAQIGAGGKIGFLGSGMSVEGSSSFKIVLMHKNS